MIESSEDCMKVAQQMEAVYSAVGNAKKEYVYQHVEGCLAHGKTGNISVKLQDFKELTKFL